MSPWWSIVIPTRNSAVWIGALVEHYLARGVRPIVLLDERTTDGTEDLLRQSGLTIHKIAGFPFTEAIVKMAREVVSTPWVLWMHDDEFPSSGLFERLRGPPPNEGADSVAIQRRWVWYEPGTPLRSGRSDQWPDRTGCSGTDHTWRLFRPDRVTFIAKMHTEGFLIDRWSRFDPSCYIVHFEWVVRSLAQRKAKLRGYDAYRYGYGIFFQKVYLPEDQPPGVIEYREFDTNDFDHLARSYFSARGPNPPDPPLSLHERWQRLRARAVGLAGTRALSKEPRDRRGLTPKLHNELPDTADRTGNWD